MRVQSSLCIVALLAASLLGSSATPTGPQHAQLNDAAAAARAGKARWLVAHTKYGIISTTSLRFGSTAFGNVNSHSDGIGVLNSTGRVFLYVSEDDLSAQDCAADNRASFTVTQESTNTTGCGGVDPGDAACSRVTLSGIVVNLTDTAQHAFAQAALFARHPLMKQWPNKDHSWLVQELIVRDVHLTDGADSATPITAEDYYAQATLVPPPPAAVAVSPPFPKDGPPIITEKEKTARWMVHQSTWGVVSAASLRLRGTAVGAVVAMSDGVGISKTNATGRLFFVLSSADTLNADLAANPNCSFTISEANLPYKYGKGHECEGAFGPADAESPICARFSVSGYAQVLQQGSPDTSLAEAALFSKHPQITGWNDINGYELKITGTFFIDMFGGADFFSAEQYYAAKL